MNRIDLNCDVGEGAGQDARLLPFLTSANIACGGHAGDGASMRATVELALQLGVGIGAHPGFNDREHFGRRERAVTPGEVFTLVLEQVRMLQAVAAQCGATVGHVKPHGALYNQAARDAALAGAVAEAVRVAGKILVLVGLAGSQLIAAGRARGLAVASEVFADRTYRRDGSLTPRTETNALIDDGAAAVAQVLQMVRDGCVRATDGTSIPIRADTVCVHGDGAHAVELARRLRTELAQAGVTVRAFGR